MAASRLIYPNSAYSWDDSRVSERVIAARGHGNANQNSQANARGNARYERPEMLNRSYSIQGFAINRVRRLTESRVGIVRINWSDEHRSAVQFCL